MPPMYNKGGDLMQLYKLLTLMLFFSLFIGGCSNEKNEENLLNTTENLGGEEMNKTIVVVETSKGTIEVELDNKKAPITTENFCADFYVQVAWPAKPRPYRQLFQLPK